MTQSRADIRYAKALFLLSEEKGQSAAVYADLESLRLLIQASPELKAFLAHPLLPADQQDVALRAMFGKRLNGITVNFLGMLAVRRRLKLVMGICERFEALYLESKNILRISIESAFELRKDQLDTIQKSMERRHSKQVQAAVSIHPALLGGFRILVHDTVHDFSVTGKLTALRLALCGG